jgi:hypothetical protein
MYHIWEVCPAEVISPQGRPFNISLEWLNVKPLDIKAMMAMIKDEPEDKYIPVLKPVLLQALTEIKQLRRKNSQLGGKVARLRSLKRKTFRKKAYFDRGEIMVEKLTANVIKKYIVDKNQPVIAADFKAKGRELVKRFGVTVPEAIDILNNRNILEILCKYEDAVG